MTAGFASTADLMQAVEAAPDSVLTLPRKAETQAEAEQITQLIHAHTAAALSQQEAFFAEMDRFDPSPLLDEAVRLVRDDWRLPWPWLAWELGRVWLIWLTNAPLDAMSQIAMWVEADELRRPAPTISFTTGPNETIEEAMRRSLTEVFAALEAAADAARVPPGRKAAPEVVERYTEWWYRHRILGQSIRSIAEKDDNLRRLVRHGIRKAERWLGIVNATWADDAAPEPGDSSRRSMMVGTDCPPTPCDDDGGDRRGTQEERRDGCPTR